MHYNYLGGDKKAAEATPAPLVAPLAIEAAVSK